MIGMHPRWTWRRPCISLVAPVRSRFIIVERYIIPRRVNPPSLARCCSIAIPRRMPGPIHRTRILLRMLMNCYAASRSNGRHTIRARVRYRPTGRGAIRRFLRHKAARRVRQADAKEHDTKLSPSTNAIRGVCGYAARPILRFNGSFSACF